MDPSWIKDFGLPTALVVGLWICLVRFSRWIAPRFDKVTNAHVQHVEDTSAANQAHAEANMKHAITAERVAAAMEKQTDTLAQLASSAQVIAEGQRSSERNLELLARSQQEVARAVCVSGACKERMGVQEIVSALQASIETSAGHEEADDT